MSWAGWVFDFYDLTLYSFLLLSIGKELHLSKLELSYILGFSLVATAIGGIVFGMLADRYGRKVVLLWSILIYSLGTFLSGFSTGVLSLLIFRTITGFGVGGEWATGQTYICETFPSKVRGRYGAIMQTGAPIGVALAAVIGGFLSPVIGWRMSFVVSVIPAIILVVLISRTLPESDLWLQRKNKALTGNRKASSEFKKNLSLLISGSCRRYFIFSLILAIFSMSAYWFTYSWLPGYLQEERQFSMAKSTLFILITQAGGFLGYFSFGFVSDKVGRRPTYSIYCTIMAIGLVMVTLLWNVIVIYPTLILTCMFLVGFGTGMFGGFGALTSELFPTEIRNTAMGSAFNLARGIQFFTPVLIALIAVQYGLGGGIFLAALFALLTGAWVWVFPETKGKSLVDSGMYH